MCRIFNRFIRNAAFQDILKQLHKQNQKLDTIMATLQELQAAVEDLQTSLDEKQLAIASAIAALEQTIQDLQSNLADGGTAEDRQAVLDKLTALKADLVSTPTS